MRNPLCLAAAGLSLAVSFSLAAEKDPALGHSAHGEAFNEGPRQAAVLIEGTGNVSFEVTTEAEEAQRFFNQGVGQLHGFWDFEAERSFRQAAAIDRECAMAYWGMAMANHENAERAKGFIAEAVERKEGVSARERMWIEGLAKFYEEEVDGKKIEKKVRERSLVRDLEGIVAEYPEDIEAKAFLLLQIYRNAGDHPIPSHLTVDLLAKEILERQPDHPAHHYRIHLWDKEKAANALDAAALCGLAAPGIAHMWHMPGHIYSRLKRYGDAAWQQEASARIDHAHMMRFQITPDDIHNFAHNNEWLIRDLNHVGRVEEAIDLACNMIELPRLPKFVKDTEEYLDPKGSWTYGRQRLRDTLMRYEMWEELIAYAESDYLAAGGDAIDEIEWNRFMGIAAYESGDAKSGAGHMSSVGKSLGEERAKQTKAVEAAGEKAREAKKKEAEVKKAEDAAKKNFAKKITSRQSAWDELKAYDLIFGKEPDLEAAREKLGKLKTMDESRKARLMLAAGDGEEAIKMAGEAVEEGKNEVGPLANEVAILWEAGKRRQARAAFEDLRKVGREADLGLPVVERFAALATRAKFKGDWRLVGEPAKDLGERPDLDSLGPFRWEAPVAPGWSLKDVEGEVVSLDDYRGRPVLVIFYLGTGCTHCMEQLTAFAPMQQKYAEAGIEIVAVSTDSTEGLEFTYQISEDEAENPFPFPLVSDEGLGTFRDYRAYDDFEEMALHGTFLIDGEGKIRWQDVGFEPFMKAEFLLEECVRLLRVDGSNGISAVIR